MLEQGAARQNAGQKPLVQGLSQFGQQGAQQQSSMASLLPTLATQGAFTQNAGAGPTIAQLLTSFSAQMTMKV